jgi:hypothetical protein
MLMLQLKTTHGILDNTHMFRIMNKLASKTALQCYQLHHLQHEVAGHDLLLDMVNTFY